MELFWVKIIFNWISSCQMFNKKQQKNTALLPLMCPSVTATRAERSQIQPRCPYSQIWTHSPHKRTCYIFQSFAPLRFYPPLTLQHSFLGKTTLPSFKVCISSFFSYSSFFISSSSPSKKDMKRWRKLTHPFWTGKDFPHELFSGQSSLTKQGGLNNFDHEFLKGFWGLNFCY